MLRASWEFLGAGEDTVSTPEKRAPLLMTPQNRDVGGQPLPQGQCHGEQQGQGHVPQAFCDIT